MFSESTCLSLKAQGTLQKRGQKEPKSQWMGRAPETLPFRCEESVAYMNELSVAVVT